MAEQKELRRMNRTELIEIIYALQQQELELRRENKELSDRLEDRAIRLESAGSIAEAALSLSHIFEDAQEAVELYMLSLKESQETEPESSDGADDGQTMEEAQRILNEAQEEADQIIDSAKTEADEIRRRGKQAAVNARDRFLREVMRLLDENPELAAALRERARREDGG